MYIPDRIRLVITKRNMVEVYSNDEGRASEPPLPVASVRVTFTDMHGTSINVLYGSSYQAIGKPPASTASVDYGSDKVTFDVLES